MSIVDGCAEIGEPLALELMLGSGSWPGVQPVAFPARHDVYMEMGNRLIRAFSAGI